MGSPYRLDGTRKWSELRRCSSNRGSSYRESTGLYTNVDVLDFGTLRTMGKYVVSV